jgi:integrative and conjugative element protein (TIGR02256 family)
VSYLEIDGEVVDGNRFTGSLSKALWNFLSRGLNSYARGVEARRSASGAETTVLDVDVEVSQIRVHDIRPVERVSVTFLGESLPEVLALRSDFPFVPHINPRPNEFPRSLCLYEENFEELSLRWTPAMFIERLRWWLSETSKGTLHRGDQPLEGILLDRFATVILPADLFTKLQGGVAHRLFVLEITEHSVFRASWQPPASPSVNFAATAFWFPPHVHGVIRWRPASIAALGDQLQELDIDFVSALKERVAELHAQRVPLAAHLVVIVVLPKQRVAGGDIERCETWVFAMSKPLSELGEALGLWQMQGGSAGFLLNGSIRRELLEEIAIDILNPTFELTRESAASLNGYEPSRMKITAIGMGALGSQITTNLVRSGFGVWAGVDPDSLLPHNVARHELTAAQMGQPKVRGMQELLNSILSEPAMETIIETNLLQPVDKQDQLRAALEGADLILDFSASLAVGRALAHDTGVVRRCSVFLNPSGSDLVVLCEDAQRETRLDSLEFQYYRKVVTEPALAGHFRAPEEKVRYARSCRDLTSRVPQHRVAINSGIAAGVLRRILAANDAFIGIWTSDENFSVNHFQLKPSPVCQFHKNGWTLITDSTLLQKIGDLRARKSRKETGGVLIGAFDHRHRIIYLTDTLPSPPDSEEWPTLYVRGCKGLRNALDEVVARSDGQLQYVGEWHSHPDRYSTDPSPDDRKVFAWLTEHMARDGNPPLMLIAGERDFRFFVAGMENPIELKLPAKVA